MKSEHEKDLEDVSMLLERVSTRFEYLTQMTDGWLDGEGKKPSLSSMASAKTAITRLIVDDGFSAPDIFPTPEGGIQAEWYDSPEKIFELVFFGETIEVYVTDLLQNEEVTETFTTNKLSELIQWFSTR